MEAVPLIFVTMMVAPRLHAELSRAAVDGHHHAYVQGNWGKVIVSTKDLAALVFKVEVGLHCVGFSFLEVEYLFTDVPVESSVVRLE